MNTVAGFLRKFENEHPCSLHPRETGLPYDIFINWKAHIPETRRRLCTRPRIFMFKIAREISKDGKLVERWLVEPTFVSIDDPIEVLEGKVPRGMWKPLKEYIKLNRDLLLRHWNSSYDKTSLAKRTCKDVDDVDYVRSQKPLPMSEKFLFKHRKGMTTLEFVNSLKRLEPAPRKRERRYDGQVARIANVDSPTTAKRF